MLLLALPLLALAGLLGPAALATVWPALVVAVAVMRCLDRPARRAARPGVALGLIGLALVAALGPWHPSPTPLEAVLWFAAPFPVAALIVLGAGGPARIDARHRRAERERQRRAAAAAELARERRRAATQARRRARRAAILDRTGLDVELLAGVAADRAGRWTRAAGGYLTRRLERYRPPAADPGGRTTTGGATGRRARAGTGAARPPAGPPDWLDLDRDVAADLSRARGTEILSLAADLDAARGERRQKA